MVRNGKTLSTVLLAIDMFINLCGEVVLVTGAVGQDAASIALPW